MHRVALHTHPLEQQLQAVLRMTGAGRFVRTDADRIPAFLVKILIESGKDDRTVLQARYGGKQFGRRRQPNRSIPRR